MAIYCIDRGSASRGQRTGIGCQGSEAGREGLCRSIPPPLPISTAGNLFATDGAHGRESVPRSENSVPRTEERDHGRGNRSEVMTARVRLAIACGCVLAIVAVSWAAYQYTRSRPVEQESPLGSQSAVSRTAGATRPALWLLSIGVSRYKEPDIGLQFADADARSIASALQEQAQGPIYGETRSLVLTNEEVTRESIFSAIERFLGQAGPDDVAAIFVAGHGVQDRATGSYYFLPYPATAENLLTEGLRMSDFDEMVRVLRRNVGRVVVMLDTCHAGSLRLASRAVVSADDLAAQVSVAEGLFLLAATKPGEESKEKPELGHGAFTYALLEGLRGAADADGDGLLSVSDLFSYVARQVPRLTEGRQHPYHKIEGTDLMFAAVRRDLKEDKFTPTTGAQLAAETLATPMPNTIGVAEFRNLTENPEHKKYGKVLQMSLNTELTKVRQLRVLSPGLIDRGKASGLDDVEAARRLGVRKLLTGTFAVLRNAIEIHAQIIDIATGFQEPSESVHGELDDFFDLEKRLVDGVLRRLEVEVSVAERQSLQEKTNTNVKAFELLLEAEGVGEQPAPPTTKPTAPRAHGPAEQPHSQLQDNSAERQELGASFGVDGTAEAPMDRVTRSSLTPQNWVVSAAYAEETPSGHQAEVIEFLEEYRRAHEQKDLDRLAALYVSLSARQREALRAYLDTADRLTVELADVRIEPHEYDVAVSYTRRDRFVDRESGKAQRVEVRLTKILVREGGKWKIAGGS